MPLRLAAAVVLLAVPCAAQTSAPASQPEGRAVKSLIDALAGGHGNPEARQAYRTLQEMGKAAIPHLTQALKDPRRNVRWLAVEALGSIPGPEVLPPLIAAMGDADKDVRRYAANYLGRPGEARALAALRKGLEDSDAEVVLEVLASMERLGDTAFRSDEALARRLIAQLAGEKCGLAAQCLGMLRNEKAVEPLVQAMLAQPRHAPVIGYALGQIGSRKAVRPLLALLKGDATDDRICRAAGSALAGLGDRSVTAELVTLMASGSPAARRAAILAMGFPGNKEAVVPLGRLAADAKADKYQREEALQSLGATGEPTAVPVLAATLADPDERVANEAVRALGFVRSPAAAAALRPRLMAPGTVHVMYVASSLGRIGGPDDARAILEAMGRPDALDRRYTFAAIHLANLATACHYALSQITKTPVGRDHGVVRDADHLRAVRETWRQKLAELESPPTRPAPASVPATPLRSRGNGG